MSKDSQSYSALGASSSKEGMLKAISAEDVPRFFAEPIDDVCGDPNYYSLLHADGVGTKAIAAYIAFKETGNPSYFRSLAQDSLVMNLDDVACVGAFEGLTLSNTIGRNKFLIPDEAISEIVAGYKETAANLAEVGIHIQLAGGETADLGDLVRTVVIDSTLFARVKRQEAISTAAVEATDIIIGLSGTGQASYESSENSGLGSNGYTLARHALISSEYAEKYPEIIDPALDLSAAYQGPCPIFDTPAGMTQNVAEALLSPTRSYAPVIKRVRERIGDKLHAAIHCSGGGQTKLLRFASGVRFVKDNLFETPPVFRAIQASRNVPWQEMYQVFNMGHRMEILCPADCLDEVVAISSDFGIAAQQVGSLRPSENTELLIESEHGEFHYS